MEEKPIDEELGAKTNFGKLSPEEQREYSRKHMPPNHDQPAINEKIALENRKKHQEEQSRNTT